GLFGLVTAKVLLHDTNHSFSDITVFEKSRSLGGVWSQDRIYPGLASNSPALTYEIPGFQFPDKLRKYGSHVKAEDINVYLSAFAQEYNLEQHISFNSLVQDVSWSSDTQRWRISVQRDGDRDSVKEFKFLVVCNGMYHQPNIPTIPTIPSQSQSSLSSPMPKIYHSANVGEQEIRTSLANSENTLVIGAGKSAIDLATMIARGEWSSNKRNNNPPSVTLLYKRPHWLSPRSIVRGTIYFERLLFSRFLNAWLPFASDPDALHAWIAQSPIGEWMTDTVFKLVADDFVKSCRQQDLPQTIPDHPFREALSGALHVVPEGYLEFVRSGRIKIIEGSISTISNSSVNILNKDGENKELNIDHILYATGYKIPYRNIAFNGFAYSLLNPTVSFVAAHWIAAYFLGQIPLSRPSEIEHGT
ncbi:FAD/NAD(P)-binding domain-containing protein, partial [Melanomma pulvis-pyrius CBS 109.77]